MLPHCPSRPRHRPARHARRAGATLVEFAIVASVFFLLVLGIIEFGRAVMVVSLLANAAQHGARAGVLDGAQVSDVTDAVNNCLHGARIYGATVAVSPSPPSDAHARENVTVTVSVPFNQVSWLPNPWFLGNKTLTAASIMRRETGQ